MIIYNTEFQRNPSPLTRSDEPNCFVINTRGNRFEPPHVHVWVDNQDTCRTNLLSGAFIERPPADAYWDFTAAYRKHSQQIREIWETIHGE